jgi:hypothetical protein
MWAVYRSQIRPVAEINQKGLRTIAKMIGIIRED